MVRRCVLSVALVVGVLAGCTPSSAPSHSPIEVTLPGGGTALSLTGAGSNATISVSEAGYTGHFTAVSSDTAIATVSSASATTFTVTAVSGGAATITIMDSFGDRKKVSVGVTTSTGVVSLAGFVTIPS